MSVRQQCVPGGDIGWQGEVYAMCTSCEHRKSQGHHQSGQLQEQMYSCGTLAAHLARTLAGFSNRHMNGDHHAHSLQGQAADG